MGLHYRRGPRGVRRNGLRRPGTVPMARPRSINGEFCLVREIETIAGSAGNVGSVRVGSGTAMKNDILFTGTCKSDAPVGLWRPARSEFQSKGCNSKMYNLCEMGVKEKVGMWKQRDVMRFCNVCDPDTFDAVFFLGY